MGAERLLQLGCCGLNRGCRLKEVGEEKEENKAGQSATAGRVGGDRKRGSVCFHHRGGVVCLVNGDRRWVHRAVHD